MDRVKERGDVHHIRRRINDFDAFDLRMRLPVAAATVAREVAQGRKVYIHCTAGEGMVGLGPLPTPLPFFFSQFK